MNSIYLDYNATTPIHPEVEALTHSFCRECFGNASSRHQAGQDAWIALEKAREQIANLVGCESAEVIFTSGATESNFLALMGRFDELIEQNRRPESIRIAISAIEHPCVKSCAKRLVRYGARVVTIPVDWQGKVKPEFFDSHCDWDIVSVMVANHETGIRQPLQEIAQKLQKNKTFFHTDGAQWAGKTQEKMNDWGVTSLSLSAHKMYGPKGIGALVIKKPWRIQPLMPGSQEAGIRGGTVNVPGAVGFGLSAEIAKMSQHQEWNRQKKLKDLMWSKLNDSGIPIKATVNHDLCLANTLHVRFPGIKAERLVDTLDQRGVFCSAGPACASGASEASPTLLAMGFTESEALEGVRFSLGRYTKEQDIEEAVQIIIDIIRSQVARVG